MVQDRSANQRRSPRQARSRATCEAIVEAASQILERHGPESFNTNEVAERAGVSIGTLYQYFPDKQAILLAAARRELGGAAPALGVRQRALVAALISMLERLGGLGAATAARGRRPSAAGASLRTRRGPTWERRCGELLDQVLTALVPPLQPALKPIPIRIERRRRPLP